MQRHERIRFFITEQCRRLDPTYRNYMYPRQVLIGNVVLPLLDDSCLTFRVNSQKKISFRIRLTGDETLNREPINIGIPMTQVESISLKDKTQRNPEPALVFLLSQDALDRMIKLCHPLLDGIMDYKTRRCARYLTVLMGKDPKHTTPTAVYCRVAVMANKFTFPFKTAIKILMNDLPLMWDDLREVKIERRKKTGVGHDRELMTEMDDEGWEWLMGFLKMRWGRHPRGGLWLVRDEAAYRRQPLPPPRPWHVNTKYEFLRQQREAIKQESTPVSPESSTDSNSNFDHPDHFSNTHSVMMQH